MNEKKPANPWVKSLLIWVGILFGLVLFVQMIGGGSSAAAGEAIAYSDFVRQVDEGNVRSVTMATTANRDSAISGRLADGAAFRTVAPTGSNVAVTLRARMKRLKPARTSARTLTPSPAAHTRAPDAPATAATPVRETRA